MLSRLGSVVALTSMTALVLVGCSPPEPTEMTPAATPAESGPTTLSETALAEWASEIYLSYLRVQNRQINDAAPDAAELEQFATPDQAAVGASEVEVAAAEATSVQGEWSLRAVEVVEDTPQQLTVAVCLDGTNVTYLAGQAGEVDVADASAQLLRFETVEEPRLNAIGEVPSDLGFQCGG